MKRDEIALTVECDVCGSWAENATSKSGHEARTKARQDGWEVGLPGDRDVCPHCVADDAEGTQ